MDLQGFFDHFLEENELVRANLMNDRAFSTTRELAAFKVNELSDADVLAKVSGNITMFEATLIRNLVDEQTGDNLHHVPYDVSKYRTLIDYQYILEEGDGEGVIHHDIVEAVASALKYTGVLPETAMYINKDEPFDPQDITRLEQIYNGPIYWLYNNLTWRELRSMLRRLNSESEGDQKDDYLRHITTLLTSPQFLEEVLLHIGDEEFKTIQDSVGKNYNVYEEKSRWEAVKNVGLLVKVHADYLVMHEKVLEALKTINFNAVAQKRRKSEGYTGRAAARGDYNAYLLKLAIKDTHVPVWREVEVPAGANFFELHLVIREVMGWRDSGRSLFKAEGFEIFETLLQMNENDEDNKDTLPLLSSFTQMDALLDRAGMIHYHSGSDDGYIVEITITDRINIDRAIPGISSYSGPVPIENAGGPKVLEKTMEILNNREHPDFTRTYEKARSMNYRERYPISAINNRLEKLFRKAHPITEFNAE